MKKPWVLLMSLICFLLIGCGTVTTKCSVEDCKDSVYKDNLCADHYVEKELGQPSSDMSTNTPLPTNTPSPTPKPAYNNYTASDEIISAKYMDNKIQIGDIVIDYNNKTVKEIIDLIETSEIPWEYEYNPSLLVAAITDNDKLTSSNRIVFNYDSVAIFSVMYENFSDNITALSDCHVTRVITNNGTDTDITALPVNIFYFGGLSNNSSHLSYTEIIDICDRNNLIYEITESSDSYSENKKVLKISNSEDNFTYIDYGKSMGAYELTFYININIDPETGMGISAVCYPFSSYRVLVSNTEFIDYDKKTLYYEDVEFMWENRTVSEFLDLLDKKVTLFTWTMKTENGTRYENEIYNNNRELYFEKDEMMIYIGRSIGLWNVNTPLYSVTVRGEKGTTVSFDDLVIIDARAYWYSKSALEAYLWYKGREY